MSVQKIRTSKRLQLKPVQEFDLSSEVFASPPAKAKRKTLPGAKRALCFTGPASTPPASAGPTVTQVSELASESDYTNLPGRSSQLKEARIALDKMSNLWQSSTDAMVRASSMARLRSKLSKFDEEFLSAYNQLCINVGVQRAVLAEPSSQDITDVSQLAPNESQRAAAATESIQEPPPPPPREAPSSSTTWSSVPSNWGVKPIGATESDTTSRDTTSYVPSASESSTSASSGSSMANSTGKITRALESISASSNSTRLSTVPDPLAVAIGELVDDLILEKFKSNVLWREIWPTSVLKDWVDSTVNQLRGEHEKIHRRFESDLRKRSSELGTVSTQLLKLESEMVSSADLDKWERGADAASRRLNVDIIRELMYPTDDTIANLVSMFRLGTIARISSDDRGQKFSQLLSKLLKQTDENMIRLKWLRNLVEPVIPQAYWFQATAIWKWCDKDTRKGGEAIVPWGIVMRLKEQEREAEREKQRSEDRQDAPTSEMVIDESIHSMQSDDQALSGSYDTASTPMSTPPPSPKSSNATLDGSQLNKTVDEEAAEADKAIERFYQNYQKNFGAQ